MSDFRAKMHQIWFPRGSTPDPTGGAYSAPLAALNIVVVYQCCGADRVMLYIATLVDGVDDTSRIIRRTLMRYLTLGSLIVFQATSVRVKKRFPTMDHILEAGILLTSLFIGLESNLSDHHIIC